MAFQIFMAILGIYLLLFLSFLFLIARGHKKVSQGKALVRTGFGGVKIALDSGMFVIPVLHKVEEMDISLKTIEIQTEASSKDGSRIYIESVFYIRVNKDARMVVEVAQTIGCERASKQTTIEELFYAKFISALKTVAIQSTYEELKHNRERFKVGVLTTIGADLNGYLLDDLAIKKVSDSLVPDLGHAFFVLLDSDKPLKKGEKVYVVDKITAGKSYIVRRI